MTRLEWLVRAHLERDSRWRRGTDRLPRPCPAREKHRSSGHAGCGRDERGVVVQSCIVCCEWFGWVHDSRRAAATAPRKAQIKQAIHMPMTATRIWKTWGNAIVAKSGETTQRHSLHHILGSRYAWTVHTRTSDNSQPPSATGRSPLSMASAHESRNPPPPKSPPRSLVARPIPRAHSDKTV